MIVVVLGSLAVPLRKALMQVADETVVRGVVQGELKRLISSNALVSELITIEPGRVAIRLISTQPIAPAKSAEVRESIERRTGRVVDLSVDAVASKSELADLLERIRTPAIPPAPVELSLQELQKRLTERIEPAIREIWPMEDAPLTSVSLGLGADGMVLNVLYEARADLGAMPEEVLLKSLRAKLGEPGLMLNLERKTPPRAARRP
jgi:hypothetical protein